MGGAHAPLAPPPPPPPPRFLRQCFCLRNSALFTTCISHVESTIIAILWIALPPPFFYIYILVTKNKTVISTLISWAASELVFLNFWVRFVFISSINVPLNERTRDVIVMSKVARTNVKSALDFPRTKAGVPYIDFKHLISQYIFSTWQERCGRKQASFCQASPGRLAVLLQAVQEGWSCLVLCPHRSYIFDPFMKDPPPQCEHCRCILTVRHILVECNHFARERKDIFGRRDLVESFRFHPILILLFLKTNWILL